MLEPSRDGQLHLQIRAIQSICILTVLFHGGCIRRCTTTLAFVRRGASKERGGTRCPGSAASEARAARLVCENMPNTVVCITWVCTPKTRFLQATEQSGVSNKILETFEGTSPLQ